MEEFSGIKRLPAETERNESPDSFADTEVENKIRLESASSTSLVENLQSEFDAVKEEIRSHFESVREKMALSCRSANRQLDRCSRAGLGSIRGGAEDPRTDYLIRSLLDNFDSFGDAFGDKVTKITSESFSFVVDRTVNLCNRTRLYFVPDASDRTVITRDDVLSFIWASFVSAIVVMFVVFPEYQSAIVKSVFKNSVYLLHSTLLIFFVYFMLHFHIMERKDPAERARRRRT